MENKRRESTAPVCPDVTRMDFLGENKKGEWRSSRKPSDDGGDAGRVEYVDVERKPKLLYILSFGSNKPTAPTPRPTDAFTILFIFQNIIVNN